MWSYQQFFLANYTYLSSLSMARLSINLLSTVTISVIIFWLVESHEPCRLSDEVENFAKKIQSLFLITYIYKLFKRARFSLPDPMAAAAMLAAAVTLANWTARILQATVPRLFHSIAADVPAGHYSVWCSHLGAPWPNNDLRGGNCVHLHVSYSLTDQDIVYLRCSLTCILWIIMIKLKLVTTES